MHASPCPQQGWQRDGGRNSSVDPPGPPVSSEKGTAHSVSRHGPVLAQSPSPETLTAEFALNKLQLSLERSVTSQPELRAPAHPHPGHHRGTRGDPTVTLGPPDGDKSPRQHTELWDGDHKALGLWSPQAQEPHTEQGPQSIQSQNFPLSILGSATHSCSRDARKRGIYQAPDARSLPGVSNNPCCPW